MGSLIGDFYSLLAGGTYLVKKAVCEIFDNVKGQREVAALKAFIDEHTDEKLERGIYKEINNIGVAETWRRIEKYKRDNPMAVYKFITNEDDDAWESVGIERQFMTYYNRAPNRDELTMKLWGSGRVTHLYMRLYGKMTLQFADRLLNRKSKEEIQ